MSKLIEGVSEKIEACAKKEFLEKGYVDASLRDDRDGGRDNDRVYLLPLWRKEGLFSAIVEPAAEEFVGIFRQVQETFHTMEAERQAESLDDFTRSGMRQMVDYMYAHFEEFQLLVTGAYGTKFQNFVEHLVDIETEYTYKFMETIGLEVKKGKPITKDFMHIMNKALFESFFEVIRHGMSKAEAVEYIDMLEKYHSAGWNIIYQEYY